MLARARDRASSPTAHWEPLANARPVKRRDRRGRLQHPSVLEWPQRAVRVLHVGERVGESGKAGGKMVLVIT